MPLTACTTSEKFWVPSLCASEGRVQVMLPVPPIAGVMQVHPGGTEIDWKVDAAGMDVE